MDIVELKGEHSNMLAGSASSATNMATAHITNKVPAAEEDRKARRKNNQAYCEFDIVAAYNTRKKHRSSKTKQVKEHPKEPTSKEHSKHKKSDKSEKSELSKKIEDLTARNEKIKQLLDSVHKKDDRQAQMSEKDDGNDEMKHMSEGKTQERRRHREHKMRRSTRCCPDNDNTKLVKEKSDIRDDSQTKKTSDIAEVNSKHRSRRDRSAALETDTKIASSRIPKITVRLKNNSDKNSSKTAKESHYSGNTEEQSKNILEPKSLDRKTREGKDSKCKQSKNDIITVYENSNIMEETDSIMSRDTFKKSKTHTRTSSFTREGSTLRYDAIMEHQLPKPVSQAKKEEKKTEVPKILLTTEHNQKQSPVKNKTFSVEPRTREVSPVKPITPRKELSFSNLNLKPNICHYESPGRMATTQTSVSRIETPGYNTLGIGVHSSYFEDPVKVVPKKILKKPNQCEGIIVGACPSVKKHGVVCGTPEVLSQTAIVLRDIMQVQELEQKFHKLKNNAIKSKITENTSFLSDGSGRIRSPLKGAISKNSRFHKTRCDPTERLVEIASKTCHDQKVSFTVEGIEPPRRIKNLNESLKSLKMENVFNLHLFPGITMTRTDLKESELQLLSHGLDRSKNRLKEENNESMRTFDGYGVNYPFIRGLGNTHSEFKRKDSSEVSYKFRKKYWSTKELPKKKSKEKKKKKSKVPKVDMGVQTGLDDLEEELVVKSERDVGVSTADNHISDQLYKDIQVQVAFPVAIAISTQSRSCQLQSRRTSQSESNITVYKEKFLKKTDYCAYKEPKLIAKHKLATKTKHHDYEVPITKEEILSSSGEHFEKYHTMTFRESPIPSPTPTPIPTPRKQRIHQRHRKCSHTRVSTPRTCHPVMSTGSIRQVPQNTKKTRSKSLTHDRDSLAEKININKATINHHHQEIAALEKCLNEILVRLGQEDSMSKMAVKGDNTITENTESAYSQKLLDDSKSDSIYISNNSNDKTMIDKAKKNKGRKSKAIKSKTGKFKSSKPQIPMSKFHRGKAYGERLKKRYRKSKEKTNIKKSEVKDLLSPVKVRSVFKNPRGFISSATSMSSKISDLGSSSTYPQSIPSLNICCSLNKPMESTNIEKKNSERPKNQEANYQGIVKKKHRLQQKTSQVNYSRNKTRSIYDMLLQYINLTKDKDIKKLPLEKSELSSEESKILILSVSSFKLRPPSRVTLQKSYQKSFKKNKKIITVKEPSTDSESKSDSKEPFFMGNKKVTNVPEKVVRTLTLTSEDSLEYDTMSRTPDLCPLTAIFNFQPAKRDYLVYNTEVISPNKPTVEVKPRSPQHSPRSVATTSHGSDSSKSQGSKLKTIVEEKVIPPTIKKSVKDIPYDQAGPSLGIAELSPILSRRGSGYPSYDAVMKSLENMELPTSEKPKAKLTSFNCNDRECSNLIFNYTSKKDPKEVRDKPSPKVETSKTLSSSDRHDSSAYHTLTTIMGTKSSSFQSPSESDTAIKNESGYESSKKSSTFRKFFKRKTLLEVFRTNKNKSKKFLQSDESIPETLALAEKRSRSPACIISEESLEPQGSEYEPSEYSVQQEQNEEEQQKSPYSQSKTVLWFNFRKKKKRDAGQGCDPWCTNKIHEADQTEVPSPCAKTCHKHSKCMSTNTWKSFGKTDCPCSLPYEQQREQCKKYASKVLMEAAERQKGYQRQYEEFEEMPLNVIMGSRKCPCKSLKQGCIKTYANKVAAIQAKSPQESEGIQVKPPTPKQSTPRVSYGQEEEENDEEEEQQVDISVIPKTEPEVQTKPKSAKQGHLLLSDEVTDSVEDGNDGAGNDGAGSANYEDLTRLSKPDDVSSIRTYTDNEIFDRLLREYERKDAIAERLSSDDIFYRDQIDAANSGVVADLQVQYERSERREEERMRGPRFSERPKPLVNVTNDTTVRPDDIGTCFARGFRPDNLMLSGDACFHINKQDKVKMSPYMLKNTESIIDFSERETPLDFLLALGFMVDEASNALKDDDIRSRLLAAITEARVWINKITTTQGTLLYLVAYKARPETMRYFLQLVEAIINKRINNAIRLDGFLRVLEDVEAGRVQMINILGEDKFEDEENEEKIVKKQLKSLFINVYTVAEKEASVSGRTLTATQVTLLRILVAKYRAGLHPHLELIARYIGQGLLENEIQLEAAMIFLSRLDTSEVKLKEFENYCGITCQLQDT